MDHDKEIDLQILDKITQTGKIEGEAFKSEFGSEWLEYSVLFRRLVGAYITESYDYTKEASVKQYYYQLNEFGEVRRKKLRKEKTDEEVALKLAWKSYKASKSSSLGAWAATAVGLIAIGVTIYFGRGTPKWQPYSKALDSTSLIRMQHAWDSLSKLRTDTLLKATGNYDTDKVEVIGTDGKPIVFPNELPPPPPPPKSSKKDKNESSLRNDTLNINDLPAIQKEIERNTGKKHE